MIFLICGEKNEGKTTRLKRIFPTVKNAYGFAAEKVFEDDTLVAYKLVDLRSGVGIPLAQICTGPDGCTDESFAHGAFCFNTAGFAWARGIFEAARMADADAFFLDEVGRMELGARGHSKLLRAALKSDMDIYMTVRNSSIKDVIREFEIENYIRIRARRQAMERF